MRLQNVIKEIGRTIYRRIKTFKKSKGRYELYEEASLQSVIVFIRRIGLRTTSRRIGITVALWRGRTLRLLAGVYLPRLSAVLRRRIASVHLRLTVLGDVIHRGRGRSSRSSVLNTSSRPRRDARMLGVRQRGELTLLANSASVLHRPGRGSDSCMGFSSGGSSNAGGFFLSPPTSFLLGSLALSFFLLLTGLPFFPDLLKL